VNNIYPITTSINKEAATINKILIESAHFSRVREFFPIGFFDFEE